MAGKSRRVRDLERSVEALTASNHGLQRELSEARHQRDNANAQWNATIIEKKEKAEIARQIDGLVANHINPLVLRAAKLGLQIGFHLKEGRPAFAAAVIQHVER